MALDELAEAAASLGGKWVKLHTKADGAIEGKVVAFEKRNRTDPEGNVVFKRGTQTPRIEWLFTLEVDPELREGPDDDGIRKLPANESMQRAIAQAIKDAGGSPNTGDRLKVGVREDPRDSFSQAEYQARWTKAAPAIELTDEEF